MADNKVTFGLKNAYYAVITADDSSTATYDTPKPLPGSVELTIDPKGEITEFYADNILYYTATSNQGYEGTLKIANITEDFCKDVLGEQYSSQDKVLIESSNTKIKPFALMFEFDGDVKAIRHVLYKCTATRPKIASSTKTSSTEPNENELTFKATPRMKDLRIKTKTTTQTEDSVYNAWYTNVFDPTI